VQLAINAFHQRHLATDLSLNPRKT